MDFDTRAPIAPAAAASFSRSRAYAWTVFALVAALMVSDYVVRQVINAIFPFLKSEWALSDAQLGSFSGIVALVVGLMAFPVSLLADRWGYVRSVTAMAMVWGVATILCGLAGSFAAMLATRALIGFGEAGYGSVGAAILTRVFPPRLHATVVGAFLAFALFGSVLGVVLGGLIAQSLGWRTAFFLVGAGGLALAVLFPMVVKEPEPASDAGAHERARPSDLVRELFRFRTVNMTYVASGLSMFMQGAIIAWAPSYIHRFYGFDPAQSALLAGGLVLIAGGGMALGGAVVDRASVSSRVNRLRLPAAYALASSACLFAGFWMAPGMAQVALVAFGVLLGAGFAGPSSAVCADVTPPAMRATVFGALTLANNLIGLAPGPFVTGALADAVGLDVAMRILPCTSVVAAAFFLGASPCYEADRGHRVEGAE
ncbi:MAG: MFS transporter [Burkholderiales bacterium]